MVALTGVMIRRTPIPLLVPSAAAEPQLWLVGPGLPGRGIAELMCQLNMKLSS